MGYANVFMSASAAGIGRHSRDENVQQQVRVGPVVPRGSLPNGKAPMVAGGVVHIDDAVAKDVCDGQFDRIQKVGLDEGKLRDLYPLIEFAAVRRIETTGLTLVS